MLRIDDPVLKEAEAQALVGTYDAVMEVYAFRPVVSELGIDGEEKYLLAADVPCAVSVRQQDPAAGFDLPQAEGVVKIFCDLDLVIAPGSELVVTQSGITACYRQVGQAKRYLAHQEILARWLW